jgi:uncharacterized NAD(P)/FAD-binding protein YdhS/quercetin dioxygenase-like cupin family protein
MWGELDISPSGRVFAKSAPAVTPALARLVNELRRGPRVDVGTLVQSFSETFGFDDVRPYVRFDHAGYVRSLIYAEEAFELRLLCWLPGQSTTLHAHGSSTCAFRVLRGTATEILLGARDRVLAPGSVVVEDSPRVHQVMNAGRDPLLTLHAYSPPLATGRVSDGTQTVPASRTIAVVGGGFAGAALAYHLLDQGDAGLRVNLVEMGPWLGRGIAYGFESDVFRLNVPASRMSLDPDVPDDFVRFAAAEQCPDAFLSRALYGQYVTARLGDKVRSQPGRLRIWRDEAVQIDDQGVLLRHPGRVPADAVVLATGLAPRLLPAWNHPRMVDAWDECALATLPRQGSLLLVGSGLSALDVLAFLDAQGFRGRVTMVSPRGHLPFAHNASSSPPGALDLADTPTRLLPLFRRVRQHLAEAAASGTPWRDAFDQLRPALAQAFTALPAEERARFMRHVRPFWDLARHRAAPDSLARAEAWQRRGALRLWAGRIQREESPTPDKLRVTLLLRDGSTREEAFDAGVRCVGPALDHREAETPLLKALLPSGRAQLASPTLGLATDSEGRILTSKGEPSQTLFALGAPRRGCTWESTSVPEIASHAKALARLLLRE